jgi:hypothetical protein
MGAVDEREDGTRLELDYGKLEAVAATGALMSYGATAAPEVTCSNSSRPTCYYRAITKEGQLRPLFPGASPDDAVRDAAGNSVI